MYLPLLPSYFSERHAFLFNCTDWLYNPSFVSPLWSSRRHKYQNTVFYRTELLRYRGIRLPCMPQLKPVFEHDLDEGISSSSQGLGTVCLTSGIKLRSG
jgi:hypothetical protein